MQGKCIIYVIRLLSGVENRQKFPNSVWFNWCIHTFGLNRLSQPWGGEMKRVFEPLQWIPWLTGRLYLSNIIQLTFSFPSAWPSATPSDAGINPHCRLEKGDRFPNQRLIAAAALGERAVVIGGMEALIVFSQPDSWGILLLISVVKKLAWVANEQSKSTHTHTLI